MTSENNAAATRSGGPGTLVAELARYAEGAATRARAFRPQADRGSASRAADLRVAAAIWTGVRTALESGEPWVSDTAQLRLVLLAAHARASHYRYFTVHPDRLCAWAQEERAAASGAAGRPG